MDPAPPRRRLRWLVQVILGLCVAALIVAGVIAVGNVARDSLRSTDRYRLVFAEIECPSPPGIDRATFLGEIQYNGRFDDTIDVRDQSLPDRLRGAFEKHPRVERVAKLTVIPPKRIVVELKFRQ